MADKLIVPSADAVVTPVLEKLYELRPASFRHLNLRSGTYWHPVLGFRAQSAVALRRLTSLIAARRLDTAEGRELLDYIASEHEAVPETAATRAEGTITVVPGAPLLGGTIPRGSKVIRTAVTSLGIDIPTCEFETITDTYVQPGSSTPVVIPIRATREGVEGNTPLLTAATSTAGVSFQTNVRGLTVSAFETAGGSAGADDPYARRFARTYSLGQYGPTSAASKLGALSGAGVRHFLEFDEVSSGTQRVLVADASWASSDRWAKKIQQAMYDADLVGFGCKVTFGRVRNIVIAVDATVVLRDTNFLEETTDVQLAIQKAVRSYFDDRADWNVWNESALRSVIARADRKIFACPSVTVRNASTGATLTEILTPDYTAEQFHYYAASNATKLTFLGPS